MKTKMIRVRTKTQFILGELGNKKDSYNSIIEKLIENEKGRKPKINFRNTLITLIKKYFIYCEECDEFRAIQVHHKDKNRKNNKLCNLLLVCRKCHLKLHDKLDEKKYNGSRLTKNISNKWTEEKEIKVKQYRKENREKLNIITKKEVD